MTFCNGRQQQHSGRAVLDSALLAAPPPQLWQHRWTHALPGSVARLMQQQWRQLSKTGACQCVGTASSTAAGTQHRRSCSCCCRGNWEACKPLPLPVAVCTTNIRAMHRVAASGMLCVVHFCVSAPMTVLQAPVPRFVFVCNPTLPVGGAGCSDLLAWLALRAVPDQLCRTGAAVLFVWTRLCAGTSSVWHRSMLHMLAVLAAMHA